jgi:hypothetical protein
VWHLNIKIRQVLTLEKSCIKIDEKPGMVVYTCNLSTQAAEVKGSQLEASLSK